MAEAPYERIPLHIREGSIIPFGPSIQYTSQPHNGDIYLYVYHGKDEEFTIYEEDGETYGYERGQYATIPISYNNTDKSVTIGKRVGSYPGMTQERDFHIILVSEDHPVSFSADPKDVPEAAQVKKVRYEGSAINVQLR